MSAMTAFAYAAAPVFSAEIHQYISMTIGQLLTVVDYLISGKEAQQIIVFLESVYNLGKDVAQLFRPLGSIL